MKRLIATTAASLAILALAGCQDHTVDGPSSSVPSGSATTSQSTATSGNLSDDTYTSPDQSFSLKVPAGWEAIEEEDMIIFKGADYASTGDGLVIARLDDAIGNYTLDSLTEMFSSEKDFEKINAKELSINGKKALLCQFRSTLNSRSVIQYQYLVDGGEQAYNLSYVIHTQDLGQLITDSAASFTIL